ncbi:arylsulfatase A-like enzyme [Wenyingzhuangia aestuarii]|nr:arylsulfatase A-like enzyme [Wenyingzhuangia aestuarii]
MSRPFGENYLHGLIRNKKPADFKGYLTTALSNDAVNFVKTNKEKPFFLYLAYNAPHQPLQAPKEDIARYAHIKDKKRRVYAAMVDVMDQGIGKVIQALEDNGIAENTLVFFLSDNGGPIPSKRMPKRGNGSSNAPFRGGKTDYFDGGVHVPFIAYWPSVIKGGQVYDKPVISIDISRTAVELAGANAFEGNVMEGENLIPFLTGENKGNPHDALFWKFRNSWAVISDGYKQIMNSPLKEPGLFNLKKDIGEQNNIIASHKDVAHKLRQRWEAWDQKNIGNKIGGYADFEKKRDKFFEEALPDGAKKSDYYVPKK